MDDRNVDYSVSILCSWGHSFIPPKLALANWESTTMLQKCCVVSAPCFINWNLQSWCHGWTQAGLPLRYCGLNCCSSCRFDITFICMWSDCSVAEDIGVHQLERLIELLTSQECEDLLSALSHPEENIFQHLERLSPEKNQLDLKPRAKRDTSSADG